METHRCPHPAAHTQHFFTAALENECASSLTDHVDTLRLAFRAVNDRYPFTLTAGVILPDHLHCIFAFSAGDGARGARWRLIQALLERVVGGQRGLWRGFDEETLSDEGELERRIDYIHGDPVRHGLVRSPRKWPFSSLHAYIHHGLRPVYWCADFAPRYGARSPA